MCVCVCLYASCGQKKKKIQHQKIHHVRTHAHILNMCYSSVSCLQRLICFNHIRSSLKKVTFGIERFTVLHPLHSEKVSFHWRRLCGQLTRFEWEERRCFVRTVRLEVLLLCADSVRSITSLLPCWTELLSSALKCCAGCCNLFSAWPDYCLLHIVWWRAAGWRDGRRRG